MSKFIEWVRQPTTLVGMALTVGGLAGNLFGSITETLAATIVTSSLPLLIPDNTSLRTKVGSVEGIVISATHGAVAPKPEVTTHA